MTATLHFIDPSRTASIARIDAVRRVYADLYDARDEDGHRRDLETHEALFLSAVDCILRVGSKERSDALKTWGDGAAYDAVCNLSYRDEAAKLEAALASYKAECERRENPNEIEAEPALQLAAE